MNTGGLSRLLRVVVAVLLTAYIVWTADPGLVLRETANVSWRWVAAGILLVFVDRALMAYRWLLLLRALTPGSRPPFPEVLRIFFVSTFVGSFLPSVAGDVYRAFSLSRLRVSGAESAASVIMDRALGVLSMVLVAVVAVAFAHEMLSVPGVIPTLGIAGAGCVLGAIGIYSERAGTAARSIGDRLPGARLRKLSASLIDATRRYARHHGDLTTVLGASVLVQGIRVLQAWCLGLALGMAVPLSTYFVFIPLIVIVMQLPITVSGLGTSQAMFALLFTRVGVPSADAVALSILFIALAIVGNLPGAFLYATRGQAVR